MIRRQAQRRISSAYINKSSFLQQRHVNSPGRICGRGQEHYDQVDETHFRNASRCADQPSDQAMVFVYQESNMSLVRILLEYNMSDKTRLYNVEHEKGERKSQRETGVFPSPYICTRILVACIFCMEPCRFGCSCLRPLCPCVHACSRRWAEMWNVLAGGGCGV